MRGRGSSSLKVSLVQKELFSLIVSRVDSSYSLGYWCYEDLGISKDYEYGIVHSRRTLLEERTPSQALTGPVRPHETYI